MLENTDQKKVRIWALFTQCLCCLNMIEVGQNVTKRYRIYYSTGSVFDRYSLGRRNGFQKKAHKLKAYVEYSHYLLLLVNFLNNSCKLPLILCYLGCHLRQVPDKQIISKPCKKL